MILDIFRPDSGQITWNGTAVSEVSRRNWGYLPEERGLYPKMEVGEHLLFLARLHGLSKQDAGRELDAWLERFQIGANRKKRIEELSKGNQQKVQFLAAMLHNPDVLVMDEPFSGLDPVNANVLKEAFRELHGRGKTIIFSTHQLEQVEELCEDVLIIDKGRSVVQGSVQEIKRRRAQRGAAQARQRPGGALAGCSARRAGHGRRQDYIEMQSGRSQPQPDRGGGAAPRRGHQPLRADRAVTDRHLHRAVGKIALPDVPSTLSA